MVDLPPITTGLDAFTSLTAPTATFPNARYLQLRAGGAARVPVVQMPISVPRGATVLSATLSSNTYGAWAAQDVSVQALAGPFNAVNLWYDRLTAIGTVGSAVTTSLGALAGNVRFELDVTDLVQAIVMGQANYGWKITTDETATVSQIRGFRSGSLSWRLDIEVSEVPVRPSDLAPTGLIGTPEPIITTDEVDDIAWIRVQEDPDRDTVAASIHYDTGWVAVTKPQLNLGATFPAGLLNNVSNTSFPGFTGTESFWRVAVKNLDGGISDWSDWVPVTYVAKPDLILNNPSGTDLWDTTPDINAELDPPGDVDTRWHVRITGATDISDVRYDSPYSITGAELDHAIPEKWRGRHVFPVEGDYRLLVRAWDRPDRVGSFGDPTYVSEVVIVTLDGDGAETPPDAPTVAPLEPGHPTRVVTWERASDPNSFAVRRDGVLVSDHLDVDEYRINPGEWAWLDEGATPNVEHDWQVRAITDGIQSNWSAVGSEFSDVEGVWMRWRDSDGEDRTVLLYGDGVSDFAQTEKRITFELPYRTEPVDIVTDVGGYQGEFSGAIENRGEIDQDVDEARVWLEALRQAPTTKVRLIWATESRRVRLRGLNVRPSNEIFPDVERQHLVSFGFAEVEDD